MTRDYTIDILRTIGTITVIMAHVSPPFWLYQIRAFDVVLLVIISGMSLTRSMSVSYLAYLNRRMKRLLIPTYICITVLFILCYVSCLVLKKDQLYSVDEIIYSYILSDRGMGYIWIVKVYLIIALFSPLLKKVDKFIKSDFAIIGLYISLLFFQHFVLEIEQIQDIILYSDYIVYIIPYCIAFWIGYRWNSSTAKFKILIFALSFIATVLFCYQYGFMPNYDKFPPDLFYLCYGISGGIIMIKIISYLSPIIKLVDKKKIVEYLSRNSFNLYLCHIIVMYAYNMFVKIFNFRILELFLFHYIIVLLMSILLTCIIDLYNVKKRGVLCQ